MIPNFRLRYPKGNLWSAGNFKASLGMITVEAAKQYVKKQQLSLEKFTGNPRLKSGEDVIIFL